MLAAVALSVTGCGSRERQPFEDRPGCGSRLWFDGWAAPHRSQLGPGDADRCSLVSAFHNAIDKRIRSAKIQLASEECSRFGQAVIPPLSAFLRIPKTGSIDGFNMRQRAQHMKALAAAVRLVSTHSAALSALRGDITAQASGYAKLADDLYRAMEVDPDSAAVAYKLAELSRASNNVGKLIGAYNERCGPNGHLGGGYE